MGAILFDGAHPSRSLFSYDSAWLTRARAFEVSPDLPLMAGSQEVTDECRRSPFALAFADTEPDAWGRRILRHLVQKKNGAMPEALEILLGVDDESRIGALRFFLEAGSGDEAEGVKDEAGTGLCEMPRIEDLGKIARSSLRIESQEASDEDVDYLLGKGTSLGGARPKCTVIDEDGTLAIGKFASVTDERNVVKGEILGLELARAAGLHAAQGRVVLVDNLPVAVIRRFDRTGDGRRIPYWSMATFLKRTDDGFPPASYTELNTGLYLQAGKVQRDLRDVNATAKEIVGRLLLNLLMNNVDDHGRNTGVLMGNNGEWVLAPAFDLNPVPLSRPDEPFFSKCYLSPEYGELAEVRELWEHLDWFGLTPEEASEVFFRVVRAVKRWKEIATGSRHDGLRRARLRKGVFACAA